MLYGKFETDRDIILLHILRKYCYPLLDEIIISFTTKISWLANPIRGSGGVGQTQSNPTNPIQFK